MLNQSQKSRREVSKEEKIAALRQEFDEIDVNHDDLLTPEELTNYLDNLLGKEFDRNVATQLYERMDKNYDGKITRDEFIKTFLEAEEILLFKIENSRKYIEDYRVQRQNAIARLDEIKRTEVLNSYNIMEDSVINITVMEGHNLGYGDIVPYCILKCGREHYQTNTSNSSNPSWNETFSFGIETGRETIELDVLDYSTTNQQNLLGKIVLQVNGFKDQLKHDEWFDLERNQGGRIHLNIQWIHSKVKFLSDVVEKWNEHIKIQEEDLFDYERDLEIIYEPFKGLQQLYSGGGSVKKQAQKYVPPPDFDIPPYIPDKKPEKKVVIVEVEDNNQSLNLHTIQKLCIDRFAYVITVTILIIALFVCFNRAAFVDIIITVAFLASHHVEILDARKLRIMMLGYGLSIILDIAWLAIYNDNWWNAGSDQTYYEEAIATLTAALASNSTLNATATAEEITTLETQLNNVYDTTLVVYLYRFVIVFSYFLLVSKCVGIIVYWCESKKIGDIKEVGNSNHNNNSQNRSELKQSSTGNRLKR